MTDRAGFEAFYVGYLPRAAEAGKPIYMDVVATQSVYREQPDMLLYLLNSIRIEVI